MWDSLSDYALRGGSVSRLAPMRSSSVHCRRRVNFLFVFWYVSGRKVNRFRRSQRARCFARESKTVATFSRVFVFSEGKYFCADKNQIDLFSSFFKQKHFEITFSRVPQIQLYSNRHIERVPIRILGKRFSFLCVFLHFLRFSRREFAVLASLFCFEVIVVVKCLSWSLDGCGYFCRYVVVAACLPGV